MKGIKIMFVNVPTSITYLGTLRKIVTKHVKNRDKNTRYALISGTVRYVIRVPSLVKYLCFYLIVVRLRYDFQLPVRIKPSSLAIFRVSSLL